MPAMLRKRKERKPKKSVAEALMRDMQERPLRGWAMFEKLRERGAFEGVSQRDLMKLENMLRTFAAAEKGSE